MTFAEIHVCGVHAHIKYRKPIPTGMVGGEIKVKYSDPMDGLGLRHMLLKMKTTQEVLNQ